MSSGQPMPSTRRRAIRGMASESVLAPPPAFEPADEHVEEVETERQEAPAPLISDPGASVRSAPHESGGTTSRGPLESGRARRPAADYANTRLVNFRIPVDLHARFRALVREAEARYPRLRRPSLTELVIALLEEGPQTADEVAELIRRKRAAEHAAGGAR